MVRDIRAGLGGRRLVWAGLRGDDVEPLTDLPELFGAFSIYSEYRRRSSVDGLAYESITGVRVDPETWDIDDHLDAPATRDFRAGLLRSLARKSVLVPYRPSQFLSSILFARSDLCRPLGIAGALQSAFEHKPWVETSLQDVPRIPWKYIADEEQLSATTLFDGTPVVLRRSRTSGGEGLVRVEDASELAASWAHVDEAFLAVAPFLEGVPVNIGAVVWRDGITLHHPSVQLIGIDGLVAREFGYCGNDFGAARDWDAAIIDEIESSTIAIGTWLREHGFRGAFGVDFLIHEGRALFTEVNPRFQGSTHASAQLDIEAGESCLLLDHVAAWLDIEAPTRRPLREIVAETPDFAHFVAHWSGPPARVDTELLTRRARDLPGTVRVELVPGSEIVCEPGAAIMRWTGRERVTGDGYSLLPEFRGVDARLVAPVEEEGEHAWPSP